MVLKGHQNTGNYIWSVKDVLGTNPQTLIRMPAVMH